MCCSKLSPDLCDPMDCSPPGSSVHGIFEARILQWFAISYQGLFPIQGLKLHLLHLLHLLYWQADSLALCHLESPGFKLYKIDLFIEYIYIYIYGFLIAKLIKNPPAIQETWVWSLCWEDPLEKGKSTHSSILAWRIPWTTVYGVTKTQTWLSDFHFHIFIYTFMYR